MSAPASYAILLRDAGSPNAEALRRAFRTFRHLTDADAVRLAANAQGILMRHLRADEARALLQTLQAEGVHAALVHEEELRFLGATELLHHIQLGADALVIYDYLGHARPVRYADFTLVAAAAVAHVEITAVTTPGNPAGLASAFGFWSRKSGETHSRLLTERQLVLELVTGHGAARYEVQAQLFPFGSIVDLPNASLTEKFVWLAREMTRRAPQALLNRAAQDIKDGVELVRGYPSRQALLDEMTWLLWSAAHRRGANK